MKLKEWGIMRHKSRKITRQRREARLPNKQSSSETDQRNDESVEPAEVITIEPESREHCTRTGGWQVVASLPTLIADGAGTVAEPTFLGLLSQPQEYGDPWSSPCLYCVFANHAVVCSHRSRRHGRTILRNLQT